MEGYVESAAIGLLVGRFIERRFDLCDPGPPPPTTALGALYRHIICDNSSKTFQPMNVNFGLFVPLTNVISGRKGRKIRYQAYTERAKADFKKWFF